jgi:hypothetical protein
MAAAEAWAYAEAQGMVSAHGGDRKSNAQRGHLISDPRSHFAEAFGVGKNYVEQARALLRDDPPAAVAVKNGDQPSLKDAYAALRSIVRAMRPMSERARRGASA